MRTLVHLTLIALLGLTGCVTQQLEQEGRRPFSRESTFPEDCAVVCEQIGGFIITLPFEMAFGEDEDDDCDSGQPEWQREIQARRDAKRAAAKAEPRRVVGRRRTR